MLHIQDHLEDEPSLDQLARLSHFSPYHFHRIFSAFVGESVFKHIRRLRLEAAARRLRQTDRSVTEIALEAGYGAHEAFTRAFKAMFGVSPSRFRKDGGAAAPAPRFGAVEPGTPLLAGGGLMKVKIERTDAMRIAFIRHLGPYDAVGPVFERLVDWAWANDLFGSDTLVLGVCHDDPDITPVDEIRYDAAITVDGGFEPDGDVGVAELAAGDHAVAFHEGPYAELGVAYRWLYGQWLPTSGREPADGPPFEVYLNNPEDTPPDELITEIHIPLKPR